MTAYPIGGHTMRCIALALAALAIGALGALGVTAATEPHCPTEDSCAIDYRDGALAHHRNGGLT
jgi:hypothetical protein